MPSGVEAGMGIDIPSGFPAYGLIPGTTSASRVNPPARFSQRLLAALIDGILAIVAYVCLLFLVFIVFAFAGADRQTMRSSLPPWTTLAAWIAFLWIYAATFESSRRQGTPGKLATRIAVTDAAGNRISFGRASLRHWAKTASIVTLGIGFLMAAFSERRRALHDVVADTLVVRKEGRGVPLPVSTPLGQATPTAAEMVRAAFHPLPGGNRHLLKGKQLDRGLRALAATIEPGEQPMAVAYGMLGPNPIVLALLTGHLIAEFILKPHFLWVTDRRVLLIAVSRRSATPRQLTFADARSAVTVERTRAGLFGGSTVWLRQPGGTEFRLNRVRTPDARAILLALSAPAKAA